MNENLYIINMIVLGVLSLSGIAVSISAVLTNRAVAKASRETSKSIAESSLEVNKAIAESSRETSQVIAKNSIINANYIELLKLRSKAYEEMIIAISVLKVGLPSFLQKLDTLEYQKENEINNKQKEKLQAEINILAHNAFAKQIEDIDKIIAILYIVEAFAEKNTAQIAKEIILKTKRTRNHLLHEGNMKVISRTLDEMNEIMEKLVQAIREDLNIDKNYKIVE
jgi:hypothetical protein